jgi:pectin methylesterase-like acyl-CoA thioesterase
MLRLEVSKSALASAFVLLGLACSGSPALDMSGQASGSAAAGGVSAGSSAGAAPSGGVGGGGQAGAVASSPGARAGAGSPGIGSSAGSPGAGSPSTGPADVAGSAAPGSAGSGGALGAAGAAGAAPTDTPQVDPAAPLTPIAFFPSKDRTDACADASVSIQFNRTPVLKAGGKIQIVEASGAVFDSVTSNPDGQLYYSSLVNRSSGGRSFRTDVLDIVYNTVVFQPKAALEYGKTYYITVDEGMITDDMGTKFSVAQSDNWTFTVRAQAPAAASTYVLAADGSGDYCSVEGVLEALPNSASSPRIVRVGPGVYPGILRMGDSQVHFVGAGMDKSIFSHKNAATMNSNSREGIVVSGSNVTFEELTIFNTYLKDSNGQQAEALFVAEGSQRVVLKNVHLRSHQDTLRVDGSAYMEGGKISGSTDPLWGYGAFYCDGCELSSRTSGHAFVVTRSTKGFGLVNCSVTKESDSVDKTYLAQYHDGSEPGKIAFVKCKIDSHIVGWRRAQGNAWYESENTKLDSGEPLMFDGRQLSAGSPELTALSSPEGWLGWSP